MAIQEITSPPMLDETGRDVVDKLQAIANNINTNAGQINYSNTSSQLQATKVQTAIDEVKGITDNINASLAQKIVIESKSLTFVSSVAVLAKKTGYVLLQVYGIRPNTETTATYHIDGWIASSDGENYYVHSSYNNLNAGLSCRVIWLKTNE